MIISKRHVSEILSNFKSLKYFRIFLKQYRKYYKYHITFSNLLWVLSFFYIFKFQINLKMVKFFFHFSFTYKSFAFLSLSLTHKKAKFLFYENCTFRDLYLIKRIIWLFIHIHLSKHLLLKRHFITNQVNDFYFYA